MSTVHGWQDSYGQWNSLVTPYPPSEVEVFRREEAVGVEPLRGVTEGRLLLPHRFCSALLSKKQSLRQENGRMMAPQLHALKGANIEQGQTAARPRRAGLNDGVFLTIGSGLLAGPLAFHGARSIRESSVDGQNVIAGSARRSRASAFDARGEIRFSPWKWHARVGATAAKRVSREWRRWFCSRCAATGHTHDPDERCSLRRAQQR